MPTREPTKEMELLARAIQASSLSSRQFAKQVLIRDPGTVRRWLAGTLAMPTIVREHLERLEKQRLETEELFAKCRLEARRQLGEWEAVKRLEETVEWEDGQLGRGD